MGNFSLFMILKGEFQWSKGDRHHDSAWFELQTLKKTLKPEILGQLFYEYSFSWLLQYNQML